MPATPAFALPYPAATDTADVPRDIQALAVKLDGYTSLHPALVTGLPGSPADGQEVYYLADAANGVVWHLRYRAAATGTSKWEAIGGPPLTSEVNATESVAAGGYTDPATPGPQVTAPLAGDYVITGQANIFTTAAVAYTGFIAPKFGAAAVQDPADRMGFCGDVGAASGVGATIGRSMRRTVAAAAVVKMQYQAIGSAIQVANRTLTLQPVRVG